MTYQGHPDQHFGPETYSQHGEDLLLLNIFRQLKIAKPTYLDLGAHHPFTISNTALLYKFGSRGVNIDANPNLIDQFHWDRPEDRNICLGVFVSAGEMGLLMFSSTSGRNTLCVDEANRFTAESGMQVKEVKNVKTATINQIVETYCGGKFPDLLTLDLEGLDHAVLESADFEKYGYPKVICVESRPGHPEIGQLLLSKGFFRYVRMGENLIFVEREAWLNLQMLG